MKRLTSALLLLLTVMPCLTLAQKKELSQARSFIKSGKDFDKAEKLMTGLLRDSANRDDERIYQVWAEAVHRQYLAANERLYLKQKQDTAAFFALGRRLFTILERLDSLDMRPDKKGRIKLDYREKSVKLLDPLRNNLFNGGSFFIRKADWKQAFDYMDTYINCAREPLFEALHYDSTDVRLPEAAYWATYSGYRMKDAALTLLHSQLAVNDTARCQFAFQFIAEAHQWRSDTAGYVAALQEGFRRYPRFPYFFPRLIDAYNAQGLYETALAVCDSALAVDDSSQLFLFAKSSSLLHLKQYSECIEVCDRLIELNDSLPEPYFNAATAFISLAEGLDAKKEKRLVEMSYQSARLYMERYRKLKPYEQKKWAPVLYRIYLYLNMGRQFDEIDRLLNDQ